MNFFYLWNMDRNTIGGQIKYWRNKRGFTQTELGEILGMSKQQVANYESGFRLPTIDKTLPKICEALNIEYDIIFKDKTNT